MSERFYSHGKLLLTAEYLVVDGANAFALPCKFGQDLVVEDVSESDSLEISWKSITSEGEVWFDGIFVSRGFPSRIAIEPFSSTNDAVALKLSSLLSKAFQLADALPKGKFAVTTTLEFPQDWGLGSSSTLVVNIASWLNINPYELFFEWADGSGYDLACASASGGILYRKNGIEPVIETVEWTPSFKEDIYFLHLGNKQQSEKEVKKYAQLDFNRNAAILQINALTKRMVQATSLNQFETVVEEHEFLISSILKRVPAKERLFADYQGSVKSLGAWGGDFVMVTKRPNFVSYFESKGYSTLLSFKDMIYGG